MPFSTNNKIQIVDESGDPVVLGSGAVTTETLRVTIATDDVLTAAIKNSMATVVTAVSDQNSSVTAGVMQIGGEAKIIDGSALPNSVGEGNTARLAVSRAGIAYTCLTNDTGASDLGTTITTH